MKRRLLLLVPLWLAAAAPDGYESVRRKFALIESDTLPPGHRVVLSTAELNAYAAREVAQAFPDGVRNPLLTPGIQTATGSALIDFGKIRRAQGKPPGFLLGKLLDGERPVRVTVSIRSAGGAATVDVQSVEVSGIVIDGNALDFLIHTFLLPQYPQAAIGRPFELGHRIDHLEISPGGAVVVIGK